MQGFRGIHYPCKAKEDPAKSQKLRFLNSVTRMFRENIERLDPSPAFNMVHSASQFFVISLSSALKYVSV